MRTFSLRQVFRYEYAQPIADLRHRLMVVPPRVHADQRRVDYGLVVRGADVTVSEGHDRFGNHRYEVRTACVETAIEFETWVTVSRMAAPEPSALAASTCTDPHWTRASVLTRPDAAIADAAQCLASEHVTAVALAENITSWVHGAMRYRPDTTDVRTTAAQALAHGSGVCQDYAHVMIAIARRCGLPARYVSGHLVGEGGSHAWVEVLLPDEGRAIAFDPTNNRRAGDEYVTVAVGRDYHDVAPTAGTFRADCGGRLTCTKSLEAAILA